MAQKNFTLSKTNIIICGIAVVIIIIGFLLMIGPGTTAETGFNPDIFSARRIKIAPMVCLAGFLLVIVGILYPSNSKTKEEEKK